MTTFVPHAPNGTSQTGDGLTVHHTPGRACNRLIVFVHGWGGKGYVTWGDLPRVMFQALPSADIGVFDYVSGKRRMRGHSPDLNEVSDSLLTQLNALQYPEIIFIAHSMGGVVTSTTIRHSHQQARLHGKASVAARTRAFIALASPRAGIKWLPVAVTRDAAYLRSHGATVAENDQFFTDQVNTYFEHGPTRRYNIPIWAGAADGDRIVDPFSSKFGIPSDQRATFRGTHTSFLRHRDLSQWLKQVCGSVLGVPREVRQSGAAPLRANFRGSPIHSDWQDSFLNALIRIRQQSRGVAVIDCTHETNEDRTTDLQVHVIPATAVDTPETEASMHEYHSQMNRGDLFALGLSTFGPDAGEAAQRLMLQIPSRAWLFASSSPAELEDEIFGWLERTIKALSLTGRFRSGSDRTSSSTGAGNGHF